MTKKPESKEVKGWTCALFGIHEEFDFITVKDFYDLTHLLTGCRIQRLKTFKKAVSMAEKLAHLDWSFTTLEKFMLSDTRISAGEIIKKMKGDKRVR